MSQAELFQMTGAEKGTNGAMWWCGNHQCRNFQGYYQAREGGIGHWQFVIYGFGFDDTTASVYRVDSQGELYREDVPIDEKSRISENGRKYGRRNWQH